MPTVHSSIIDVVPQLIIAEKKTWATPNQYTLLTGLSIGSTNTQPDWGFTFRCGNLPSGNTLILNRENDALASPPPGNLITLVKDDAPIMLNGTTIEVDFITGIPGGNNFINMSFKDLNSGGNNFFPNYCTSTTFTCTGGYDTVLNGPTSGAYKIMSLYVTSPGVASNTFRLFLTDATLNTPPSYPLPYLTETSTSGISFEMLKGNHFYLTSGQNLVFSSSSVSEQVTITYAVVQ